MKKKNTSIALRLSAVVLAIAAAQSASAVPINITGLAVFRADRTANPLGFSTTALNVQVQVSPSTSLDTRVFVTNSVDPSIQYEIGRVAEPSVFAGQHIGEIAYDPALTGFWTARAENGGDTATGGFRPAFLPVEAMPFVENIGFTGTGNDITIHWDVSDAGLARLDNQTLSIWDITNPLAPFTVQFTNLVADVREIALTGLNIGNTYAVEILNTDRNDANGVLGAVDAFSGTWLSGWIPTTGEVYLPPVDPPVDVPEPASLLLLLSGIAGLGVARRRRG